MALTLAKISQNLFAAGQGTANHLRWDLSAPNILSLADELITHSRAAYDQVAASRSAPSWETTLSPINTDDIIFRVVESMCTFPQHVSTDKEIRDASTEADNKLSAYSVELESRFDVYEAVQAYAATKPKLEGEKERFLQRILRNFHRKGMHLDAATREKVIALNKQMKEIEIVYSKNLGEENEKFSLTAEQLAGLPDDFLSGLEKDESGKYIVTLKYPHSLPILKLCKVPATRAEMERRFNSRCLVENTAILEKLVTLRHEVAQLLGFPTHAAYITAVRMASNPAAVQKFLAELSDKLTPIATTEMAVLLDLKKKDPAAPPNEPLQAWDMVFYRNMVETECYNVDHQVIKKYFPIEKVTSGILEIYQEILGLKFEELKDQVVWHPDVKTYKVVNAADQAVVGFFYLDMYPREGKYGHAACWGLQPSCDLPDGRLVPVSALVCNFSKPTPEQPSLLLHDEVETFFHEFGHAMHNLCSTAELAMFSGTAVERDFVEAPSQMLENWAWEPIVLARLSAHHVTGEQLPEDLVKKLVASRNANSGILNKRQILLGTFDQSIHTVDKADTAATLGALTQSICGFSMTPGTNMAASFGHLAGGYDAQYYGYMWSEVFSCDMYETVFKGHAFDPAMGARYRKFILAPGGSLDAADMLRNFLGRDPTPDAFLAMKGLSA